jgi:hypothetical protein
MVHNTTSIASKTQLIVKSSFSVRPLRRGAKQSSSAKREHERTREKH